jgi:RNA polymerase sigma-70 factor (ECF subfamily)
MRAGEQRAFDLFFDGFADRLAAFAARRSGLDAASLEDIVQNTLIKAVRNLAGYRARASLFTWLAQICRHELADARRSAQRRPACISIDSHAPTARVVAQLRLPDEQGPLPEVEAQAQQRAIVAVLDSLPARYALVLEAKYGDGLSVENIAKMLGTTPVATQSVLARARDAFSRAWRQGSELPVPDRLPS